MRKRILAILLALLLIPQAGLAAAKVKDFSFEPKDGAVAYAFLAQGASLLQISYKSSRESGTVLISGEDGAFLGEIPLPLTYAGNNVTLTVLDLSGKKLAELKARTAYPAAPPAQKPAPGGPLSGVTVCLDPGHQLHFTKGLEPIGPGLPGKKQVVLGMAEGVVTRRKEAAVVLEIGLMLRDLLLSKGANVVMTREAMDVTLSNLARADIANSANADITLRLHANYNKSAAMKGISVYAPLRSEYAKALADTATYTAWGQALLDGMQSATGGKAQGVYLRDTYVGSNWCKMPVFLVEMGYMSNQEEDLLLSMPQYQQKLCEGMAQGVEEIARMRGLIP